MPQTNSIAGRGRWFQCRAQPDVSPTSQRRGPIDETVEFRDDRDAQSFDDAIQVGDGQSSQFRGALRLENGRVAVRLREHHLIEQPSRAAAPPWHQSPQRPGKHRACHAVSHQIDRVRGRLLGHGRAKRPSVPAHDDSTRRFLVESNLYNGLRRPTTLKRGGLPHGNFKCSPSAAVAPARVVETRRCSREQTPGPSVPRLRITLSPFTLPQF